MPVPSRETRNMTLLLIEDERMDIELMLDAFRSVQQAPNIQVAETGQKGLDYLFGRGQYADRRRYPLPDVVLLDLKMPGISGHDVLEQVKRTPVLKRVPVVILTSSKEEADLLRSYDSGANSYLVKPMSFGGFLDVIRQVKSYWLSLNVSPVVIEP